MTVRCENCHGWFVDHKHSIELLYGNFQNPMFVKTGYKCPDSMFDIESPFVTDSHFLALQKKADCEQNVKTKKRKRKIPLNDGEKEALEFHMQVVDILVKALEQLMDIAMKQGHFTEKKCDTVPVANNLRARSFSLLEGPGDSLKLHCCQEDLDCTLYPMDLSQENFTVSGSIFNTLVKYPNKDGFCKRKIMDNDFLIPPDSAFLMSDINNLQPLIAEKKKYNIIVMDPPWENKSVKRKKMYSTMQDSSLLQLPMEQLCHQQCLVIIWVTNKQRQHRFIMEELFPKWNIQYKTHWYWLKVTKFGEPVVSLNSGMKKPYECLILGQTKDILTMIPEKQVILSIPCATHSRKPPLDDILRRILQKNDMDINSLNCLELFARNLNSGWTSWGNEVLKHQHVDFFTEDHLQIDNEQVSEMSHKNSKMFILGTSSAR